MRKLLCLFIAVSLFVLSQAAFAGHGLRSALEKELNRPVKLPDQKSVVFFVDIPQYGILKDAGGSMVLSDYVELDVAPFVYNDRVYVPVRPLLNAASIPDENISFAGNEVRVKAYPGTEYSIELVISLDRPRLTVNGREWPAYGPPVVRDGRTCLPVREIGEVLTYAVYWQDPTDDAPGTVTFLSLFDIGRVSRSGSARDALKQAREAAEKLVALSDVTLTFPVDQKYLDSMYNARLAAERINGTVLQPGEIFSFNVATGPRTLENGFKYGLGFLGPDLGSGVCRTATILYQAARDAGLEIVERHTHIGGDVPYASHEDDAAVQWGVADLKFRNSFDFPVKIRIWSESENSLRAKIIRVVG